MKNDLIIKVCKDVANFDDFVKINRIDNFKDIKLYDTRVGFDGCYLRGRNVQYWSLIKINSKEYYEIVDYWNDDMVLGCWINSVNFYPGYNNFEKYSIAENGDIYNEHEDDFNSEIINKEVNNGKYILCVVYKWEQCNGSIEAYVLK